MFGRWCCRRCWFFALSDGAGRVLLECRDVALRGLQYLVVLAVMVLAVMLAVMVTEVVFSFGSHPQPRHYKDQRD